MNNALILNNYNIGKVFSVSGVFKINLKIWLALGIMTVVGLLVFYIFQVSNQAQEFYKLNIMEKEFIQVSQENKDLQVLYNNLGALEKTTNLISKLNFEKAGKIHYIKTLGNQIVTK